MSRFPLRTPILSSAAAGLTVVAGLAPARAWAHVKWFEPYDVTRSPIPIRGIMTTHFVLVLAGFTLLMVGGFMLDRLSARSGRGIDSFGRREASEEKALRAGMGAFFVALFTMGGIILTPELHTEAGWPAWLQLGIAASMFWQRTCVLGAAGIIALYAYGITLYGVFHLADYVMFPASPRIWL